jgi:hypothetical protein
MTICIAAMCQQDERNEESRIVLCYDWKAEQEFGGSETSDKMRDLPKGWVALMAGVMPRAEELVAQYETHLRTLKEVKDDADLFAEMKIPARKHKENLATDYIWQTMGVSYADLVSPAKKFPESIVEQRLNEVAQIKLGATIILAGFAATDQGKETRKPLPYIFVVDDQGDHQDVVRVEENFAAIGTGAYVAIPALHQREQDDGLSLMQTLYNVMEAKILSQVVPGVGQATEIDVLYPDGTLKRWSNPLFDRLGKLFDKLGPTLVIEEKDAKKHFEFKEEYLIPFDADEEEEKPKPKNTSLKRSASQTPEQAQ